MRPPPAPTTYTPSPLPLSAFTPSLPKDQPNKQAAKRTAKKHQVACLEETRNPCAGQDLSQLMGTYLASACPDAERRRSVLFPRVPHRCGAESGCSNVSLHQIPATNLEAVKFPLASGQAGSDAAVSTGICRHLEMGTLLQTPPALANQEQGTPRWASMGSLAQAATITPALVSLMRCPLNEQAAGMMMTKPL